MRQGKIWSQEPSLRVPFVVAGPGIPKGQRFDPITTEDITATILDLAGAAPPHPSDGTSVVPSFQADKGWRAPLLTEGLLTSSVFREAVSDPAAGFDDPRSYIGLRTPRWKYTRYDDGDGELYDLDSDPNELHNHYGDPGYSLVQDELETALARAQGLRRGGLQRADAGEPAAWPGGEPRRHPAPVAPRRAAGRLLGLRPSLSLNPG